MFWLVAGLRFETGVDWPGYTDFYNRTSGLNETFQFLKNNLDLSQFEIGYVLLNSFIKTFSNSIQALFLIIAFFTSLMLFKSVKNYSNYPIISLLIYFCTIYFILDMSGIRQCIALNIFLSSLRFLAKRNIFKYFLLIGLATLFHTSSLLLFPLYFIINSEFKTSTIITILCIGMFIAWNKISWISFVLNSIFDSSFYVAAITNKLYGYSNKSPNREFGLGYFVNFFLFIFCLTKRKYLENHSMSNIFINMYFISLFFYYYLWEITEISSRYRLYFSIGNLFIFPYIIDIYKRNFSKLIVFISIVLFSVFFGRIYLFEMQEAIAYNPYQNYIIHHFFDLQSTGNERLQEFSRDAGDISAP